MLDELLALLQAGGTQRVDDLARELGTTPALVTMMLEGLERMGYLSRVGGRCESACQHCPLARQCAVGSGSAVWTLKERAQEDTSL